MSVSEEGPCAVQLGEVECVCFPDVMDNEERERHQRGDCATGPYDDRSQ
jgi:hypothetical protein